jgi:hypothetical protein
LALPPVRYGKYILPSCRLTGDIHGVSYRPHKIKISATPQAGVSIQGLTDHELHLIDISLAGMLDRADDRDEAAELRALIRDALNRKFSLREPSASDRTALEILNKHLPQ